MANEWNKEERDRIAGLTRDELIEEAADADTDAIICDRDHEVVRDMLIWGQPGLNAQTTWSLRNDRYDNEDVPESERRFHLDKNPDSEREFITVGDLITELIRQAATTGDGVSAANLGDKARWRVMMQHDLDGDVVLGARIIKIKVDGFHRTINLTGPVDTADLEKWRDKRRSVDVYGRAMPTVDTCKEMIERWHAAYPELVNWRGQVNQTVKPVDNRCHKLQLVDHRDGWFVEQCIKEFGHEPRHKFQDSDGVRTRVAGPFSAYKEADAKMEELNGQAKGQSKSKTETSTRTVEEDPRD